MIKKLLLILLLLPSLAFGDFVNKEVIKVAKSYSYVREKTNNNDAPEIDVFLKYARASKGDPWCAAFVTFCYKEAYEKYNRKSPVPRYASVSAITEYATKHPFEFKVISTKAINWNVDHPIIGDMVSWKHGSSVFTGFGYKGHFGLDENYDEARNVYTIEGNTKAGAGGDQSGTVKGNMKYGHEGVYERVRRMDLKSNFPIMFFVRIRNNEI